MVSTLLLAALVNGGCSPQPAPDMANPASKFCVDQGHKWEIRTGAGGEAG